MIYIGNNQPTIYLGDNEPVIYLGDNQVYPMGPFAGLQVKPAILSLSTGTLSGTIRIKSSESWIITTDSNWFSLSQTSGTSTNRTDVLVQAQGGNVQLTGYITAITQNYSSVVQINYEPYTMGGYLDIIGAANFATSFNPYIEYTKNNYIRFEMNYEFIQRGYMFFGGRNTNAWFSYEWSIYGPQPYFNFAQTGIIDGVMSTSGFDNTFTVTFDNGSAVSSEGKTGTFSGNPANNIMILCDPSYAGSIRLHFYRMKVYNSPTTLAYDFRAATDGIDSFIYDAVNDVKIYPSGSGTATYINV